MRIEATRQVEPVEWDGLVCQLGGSVFHTSDWARYTTAAQPNAKPLFMRFVGQDGDPVALALAFTESSRHRLLASLTATLWTDAFPVLREPRTELASECAAAILGFARQNHLATVTIGSFGNRPQDLIIRDLGLTPTHYWEFVLDLSAPVEDLCSRMEYKRRKNIRKAERSGVLLEDSSDEQGVAALRRMQRASSQRIVARGGPEIGRTAELPQDPVMQLLGTGLGRLVLAKVDGQIVSAGLFTHWNGLVYHTLSGHSETALQTQAPTLLLWETIKRYKSEGASQFNFGGCSADAEKEGHAENGVYVYKMGFGGERRQCVTYTKTLRPISRATTSLLRKLLRRSSSSPRHAEDSQTHA